MYTSHSHYGETEAAWAVYAIWQEIRHRFNRLENCEEWQRLADAIGLCTGIPVVDWKAFANEKPFLEKIREEPKRYFWFIPEGDLGILPVVLNN